MIVLIFKKEFERKDKTESSRRTQKMKRCPQCNRVEPDEALKFCRVDGATLVSDSASIGSESGTAQLGSRPDASEVHTSILPQNTQANVNRATAPTTVLPAQAAESTTLELKQTYWKAKSCPN